MITRSEYEGSENIHIISTNDVMIRNLCLVFLFLFRRGSEAAFQEHRISNIVNPIDPPFDAAPCSLDVEPHIILTSPTKR